MESRRPLMTPTPLCIVPRSMSRFSERARIRGFDTMVIRVVHVALVSCGLLAGIASSGCEQIDARNRNKQGLRLFRETQFIDAAAQFQRALSEVESPTIHYNLGLAYSKMVKTGFDGPVLLGVE